MRYSKGDTIEIEGTTALVLEDGLTGMEFYHQYVGTKVSMICPDLVCYDRQVYECDRNILEKHVWAWYYILIGDRQCWYSTVP